MCNVVLPFLPPHSLSLSSYLRFTTSLARIKAIISHYSNNLDMELQQRAVEYVAIFSKHDKMRFVEKPRIHCQNS